jgi:hypothetical protein
MWTAIGTHYEFTQEEYNDLMNNYSKCSKCDIFKHSDDMGDGSWCWNCECEED